MTDTPGTTPALDNGDDTSQEHNQAREPEDFRDGEQETNGDMFPRKVVEDLRAEAAAARVKAKETEALKRDLFTARVERDGRLFDAEDMPYSEDLLSDPEALTAAIDALLERKPYLGKRPAGDVGAGARGPATPGLDLIGAIRQAQDNRR